MAVLGVGSEIVECVRIRRMIETHGEAFLERVYTENEISQSIESAQSAVQFASRWAAKEAVMRGIGGRRHGVGWTEIEILTDHRSGPYARLFGRARQRADALNAGKIFVSIAACRTHVTAHAVITDQPD